MKMKLIALLAAGAATGTVIAGEPALLDALKAGDHDGALKLLAAGADAKVRGNDGTTTVMLAAYNGDADLTQRLVKAGADVNAVNDYGATALSEASIAGSVPIIKTLLGAGADAKRVNGEGETALMEVARTGNVEAAKLLLAAGTDINAQELWGGQSALMWAAARSQPEMVKLLLSKGANANARGLERDWQRRILTEPRPKDMNRGGFTALLYAAREGCIECARNLVAGGADINLPDPERVTPLSLAINNLHYDLATYLIEAGADVDKWDLFGRTPLYQAVDMNTLPTQGSGSMSALPSMDKRTGYDVAKTLLEHGANANIQLKRRPPYRNVPNDRGGDTMLSVGATPLLRAARAGDTRVVKLLLEHGALVDLPSNNGDTPLMAAAGVDFGLRVTRGRNRTKEDVLATMQVLVDAGADVNARNMAEPGTGDKPYEGVTSAARVGNYQFRLRGAQVPSPNAVPHRTALHGAAQRGYDYVVKFLAEHGAELDARDVNGKTPLDLAMGNYSEDFLRQKPEPHPTTVALLKSLLAANASSATSAIKAAAGGADTAE